MRRSLILTVAAAVTMVLLAMLVPMAVLLRDYALEDRLLRAALEVQATETVVSEQGRGRVSRYVETVNVGAEVQTTVLYPPDAEHPDGDAIGPAPGEDADVVAARRSGQASVRDIDGGAEILVPVSLGASGDGPAETPVIRIQVRSPGLESGIVRSWLVLVGLGIVLLVGALVLADRLGRSFVLPIRRLAGYAVALGGPARPDPLPPAGPEEVRELTAAMNQLVGRIEALLERERASVADLSHRLRTPMTALRLRFDAIADPDERAQLAADLDELQATVDHIVREARRSEREGLVARVEAVAVVSERVRFWAPLAEDLGRPFAMEVGPSGPVPTRTSERDLQALVDVLLDNAFTHTGEEAAVTVRLADRPGGGLVLTVDDGGPGFPPDLDVAGRGASGTGGTGLGLAIAQKTATESGGGLRLERSPLGGGRVVVELGPPA